MNTVNASPLLRDEQPEDGPRIHELTESAFREAPHRCGREQHIVDELRAAGALSVSLVAVIGPTLVGHVALSPVTLSDASGAWFGLGPISVIPSRQRQGIGSLLMNAALARLRERGAAGCVLVGDPAFYHRFGFASDPEVTVPGVPPEVTLVKRLTATRDRGRADFHPAFGVT